MRDCFVSHLFLRLLAADSPDGCLPSVVASSRDADSFGGREIRSTFLEGS